jgi:alpha-L-rhamnosidase
MNSFNHYSYGAIGDWLYRVVTGIDTYEDAPGYKHIKIQPHLNSKLTYANADLKTYYGTISSHWRIENDKLHMDLELPANTTATVYIPATSADLIKESNVSLNSARGIKVTGKDGGYVIAEVGSGKYHFVSTIK